MIYHKVVLTLALQTIVCPHCHREILLTEAITHQITEEIRKEYENKNVEREKQLTELQTKLANKEEDLAKAEQTIEAQVAEKVKLFREQIEKKAIEKAKGEVSLELEDLRTELKEKTEKLSEAEKEQLAARKLKRQLEEQLQKLPRDLEDKVQEEKAKLEADYKKKLKDQLDTLGEREKALAEREQALEAQVTERLAAEKETLRETLREEWKSQFEELQGQLDEKSNELAKARELELKLRAERRQLEEDKNNLELEAARKLDEERQAIREKALLDAAEAYKLKERQKDEQMNTLRNKVEELQLKLDQGSQQAQGEALELELEDVLRSAFPYDVIEPVSKGARGADVLQKVHTPTGQFCGSILWETKRTKGWANDWIPKLKDDQRTTSAEVAILLSMALPKEVRTFAFVDGVWVTDFASSINLAHALRIGLVEVAMAKLASVGKQEKIEMLYEYLSGTGFRQRVQAIVEAFRTMQDDLNKERAAINKAWAKREKQIQRIIINTTGLYGDLEGIIGASLPQIESLDLNALPAAAEETVENVEVAWEGHTEE